MVIKYTLIRRCCLACKHLEVDIRHMNYWCSLHNKPVNATDLCDDFEERVLGAGVVYRGVKHE